MKKKTYLESGASLAAQPDKWRLLAMIKIFRQMLLALAIIAIAGTSSGCLFVHDDAGNRHWWWHHEYDHHDHDHDHDMDHHDHD